MLIGGFDGGQTHTRCRLLRAESEDDADVVVLNTCCIRENADNKLYGNLGHLKPWKEARDGRQIMVAGCLALPAALLTKPSAAALFPIALLLVLTQALRRRPCSQHERHVAVRRRGGAALRELIHLLMQHAHREPFGVGEERVDSVGAGGERR